MNSTSERIVPAVPSASGVADVFAFQKDGTVAAITSDGTTAWTANIGQGAVAVPDFQGGLVVRALDEATGTSSIWKVDGMTGQAYAKYRAPGNPSVSIAAVHPDGTVFALDSAQYEVIGIDPTTGAAKFTVPMVDRSHAPVGTPFGGESKPTGSLIAGDGNFYVYYVYREFRGNGVQDIDVLRIGTDRTSAHIPVVSYETDTYEWDSMHAGMITSADAGVLLTWEATSDYRSFTNGLAVVSGDSVSLVPGPQIPGQNNDAIAPVLQAQDGSFVGAASVGDGQYMISFDAGGNTRWTVPNMCPQIATADGGVIAQAANRGSCENLSGAGYTFDANGNATGQMSLLTQSWTGEQYSVSSTIDSVVQRPTFEDGASFSPTLGGNPSANGTAFLQCPCLLQAEPGTMQTSTSAEVPGHSKRALQRLPDVNSYLLLAGAPGLNYGAGHMWNVGQAFNLAAETMQAALTGSEHNSVIVKRVSSVSDVNTALTSNGMITGGVVYFGHGGIDANGNYALFVGQDPGDVHNISILNVNKLSNSNLGDNATVTLNACHAGYGGRRSIAQLIANRLRRKVLAYNVDMYFSANPTPRRLTPVGYQDGKPIWEKIIGPPVCMVPNGNLRPIPFTPFTPK